MTKEQEQMTVRAACRRRMPLDGANAQALEGALAMTERERDDAKAQHNEALNMCASYMRHLHKAEAERDESRRLLSELLARIHRDGGHYEIVWGRDKATADADTIVLRMLAALQDIAEGDYSDPLCMKTPEQRAREALGEK